jgi:hypothetical protein
MYATAAGRRLKFWDRTGKKSSNALAAPVRILRNLWLAALKLVRRPGIIPVSGAGQIPDKITQRAG